MTQPFAPTEPPWPPPQSPARPHAQGWRGALCRMGLGLAAVLASNQALAQGPAPCDDLARQARSADELHAHLQRCQKNAVYLALLGRLYNTEQRYLEAAEHLERALLFDPNATAAQMDYAIALAGSGDTPSALQLIGGLLARADLAEPQRASLMAARARWAQASTASLQQTRLYAGLRMGYDNNLLGAPNLSSLSLTFPGEVVNLPLDGSNLPRPGAYQRADARLDHTRIQPDGTRWDISLGLLQRQSQSVPEAGSRQLEALAERSRPGRAEGASPWQRTGHYINASTALLNTRSNTRYRSLAAAAGGQWQTNPTQGSACQWRLGGEAQQRSLQSNTLLSGRYTGLAAQWACASAAQAPQWRINLRGGRDQPVQAARPGGAQTEYALRGLYSTPVGRASAWLLEAELSHTRDATGYSPLLENGARRTLNRLALRTEYQHSLQPGLSLLAGAELVAQQSNLPLFNMHSRGIYLGVRGSW